MTDATGDDVNGLDDEDALVSAELTAGSVSTLRVAVRNATGAAAALVAFLDWNADGDFADVGEQAEVAVADATDRAVRVDLSTPGAAVCDGRTPLALRLILSRSPGRGPTGFAEGGEVEDHYLICASPDDWGDLPEGTGYNVSRAAGGPHHRIVDDLRLGAQIDAEADGLPSNHARGDDAVGADDEDGVEFASAVIGAFARFRVAVTNAAQQSAHLAAFVDWNGDGDFGDDAERQAAAIPGNFAGPIPVVFEVPADAVTGVPLGVRFRLSFAPGLGPDGPADAGEVEDYVIEVQEAPVPELSLGDRVWEDTNDNGLRDPGERGIPGVVVRLYRAGAASPTATDDTGPDGGYLFTGLPPGRYYVEVQTPEGFVSSTDGPTSADPENGIDDDDNGVVIGPARVRSAVVTLDEGAEPEGEPAPADLIDPAPDRDSNRTLDFGLRRPLAPVPDLRRASLGNLVWDDADNDGVFGGGEAGLGGVVVNLLTPYGLSLVATTLTNARGYYLFTQIAPGAYLVEVAPPPGFVTSTGVVGSVRGPFEPAPDPDGAVDGDDNGTLTGGRIRSGVVHVALNSAPVGEQPTPGYNDSVPDDSSNLTVDFGLFRVAPAFPNPGVSASVAPGTPFPSPSALASASVPTTTVTRAVEAPGPPSTGSGREPAATLAWRSLAAALTLALLAALGAVAAKRKTVSRAGRGR